MADTNLSRLAGGVALAALLAATPAFAQGPNAAETPAAAAPATIDDAAAATPADDIVVLGFGRSRQVQSITSADIAMLPPGTSPLKAIEKLPGVQFQAADAFGAYEWAVRISLRGFNQNQLGFTLDDVPLGDMSYGNVNGLHISRAIISENLGRTDVAQGAGALGTPSTSNLGGTIQFYSDKPHERMGITASGTYGADSTYRAYLRYDTGDITGNGLKAYISYAFLKTDKWRGDGPQRQHQANAKVVQDLGTLGSLSAFFNYSSRRETDYQDLTLDLFNRLGKNAAYRIDNTKPNYALAEQLARAYQNGTAFPAPYQNVDDAYYDAGGLRDDYLAGTTFDAHLTPDLSLKTTGYFHHNKGQGSWFTPYTATPVGAPDQNGNPITNPSPLSFRTTEYAINRGGVVTSASYVTGPNTLEVGGWYESNSFHQARRYYGLTAGSPNRAALDFQSNPFFTQYEGYFDTETMQYHVSDTLKLFDDMLVLNGGWKGVKVNNKANVTVGSLASGKIDAKDWFQPQVGAVLHVASSTELFADYTENMRAFVSALTTGPFSTTQAGFNALSGKLKPETSKTYEGGARFHSGPFQASAVGYYIDFSNRLAAFANGSGIAGNPAILNNVGSVHAYGAELTANYRLMRTVSLFGSYSYNHSKYQDNVVNTDGSVYAFTKGKYVVDAPENMVKGEIAYDDGNIFGRIGGDYMSKRYFSYENDLVASGRFVADASLGYRFTEGGFLKGFSIEASVTNLTDKKYISTVNTNNVQVRGYTNTANSGLVNGAGFDADNPNFMVGAPRQWFVTLKKSF
ncbi:TonB-dependent receptor domain-containing protein [Sphingomonas nostoxanthinifaciens]|uniref:TonB-dependent receptor domain-containing protein n=1 Tax=Sphingomonas nostoxanthinifaciens TaxID=2872652 RepID=UPI001CC21691|nr:TonB-dependent receptor [Sphingomonas nostoxanthinifaciens]UAK23374.1 TonB-dependent receptor [Sphingomonas nostoxanthinifaciens]